MSQAVSAGPGHAVRWVTQAPEYRRQAAAAAWQAIPVLRPGWPAQAARWRQVIDRQFVVPETMRLPGPRLAVAWGPDAEPAALLLERLSGARRTGCASLGQVLAVIMAAAEPEVVLLAPAALLTVAALTRISAICRESGKQWGVLCGRDLAGLSFAAAKSLLAPHPGLGGVATFDAPLHRADGEPEAQAAAIARELTQPTLAKVLRTHGEGGHAKLPGTVVCGLLDQAEFPAARQAGCAREPRRCKRARPGTAVVFGGELAAPVIAFVCCNGFNVAGELYPSPVSMALAFAEGWAGAVIAPIRPLIAPDDMVGALHSRLVAGEPLGAVVARLNEMRGQIGQRDPFVLHGDPSLRLPPAGPGGPAGPAATAASLTEPGGSAQDLDGLRDWLVGVLRGAERGRRLLRSARAWLGGRADELLPPATIALDQVEQMAVNAVKWADINPAGESLRSLLRTRALIRLGLARWQGAAAELLLAARDTLDAFDLGHYDQVLADTREGAPCARCGTPLEIHVYGRGEPADDQRLAELCPVCGPVSEGRAGGLRLLVRSPATGSAGMEYALGAELRMPEGGPRLGGSVQIRFRFYDKASDRCAHDEARACPAGPQLVEFRFRLPEWLGTDLHSVRLVAVSEFDVAYARARFASLPVTSPGGSL